MMLTPSPGISRRSDIRDGQRTGQDRPLTNSRRRVHHTDSIHRIRTAIRRNRQRRMTSVAAHQLGRRSQRTSRQTLSQVDERRVIGHGERGQQADTPERLTTYVMERLTIHSHRRTTRRRRSQGAPRHQSRSQSHHLERAPRRVLPQQRKRITSRIRRRRQNSTSEVCCDDHVLRWPFRYGTSKTMSCQVGAASTGARSRSCYRCVRGVTQFLDLEGSLQLWRPATDQVNTQPSGTARPPFKDEVHP